MSNEPITRDTRHCRAVLEFNLGPYDVRRPLYTARYNTLGELLGVVKAFNDALGTKITSIKVQQMAREGNFQRWNQLEHSDWAGLQSS